MNSQRYLRIVIFVITMASIVLAAALPQGAVFAQEDVIRLTIENDSDRDIWLKLNGAAYYYLHVRAGETKAYTPLRGVYDYTYYACGTWVKGEMNLNTHKTFEVPDCGYRSHFGQNRPDTFDGGLNLNLANVTFENETGAYMTIILNGPSVFVFTFQPGEDKEYTIPTGSYSYTVYGCGGNFNGSVYARMHKVKEITCP